MIFWTIQHPEALAVLEREGVLRVPTKLAIPELERPYAWMQREACNRLGPPPVAGLALIWVWRQWDGVLRRRPDLRTRGHVPPGEPAVRLELELAPETVLLSGFEDWHCVLNEMYLPLDERDDDEFDRFCRKRGVRDWRQRSSDRLVRQRLESSWQRIFEERPNVAARRVQGVTWEVPAGSVRRVDWFHGR